MCSKGYCTWFVCLCVCVSVCVCLHLFSPYRNQAGSSAIPTTLVQQGLESNVAILLKWRRSRDMALKQVTKPPTSTDRYRFRLSGTLAVLRWRGATARTITRFQWARGVAVRWGAARMLASWWCTFFVCVVYSWYLSCTVYALCAPP